MNTILPPTRHHINVYMNKLTMEDTLTFPSLVGLNNFPP